jgi:tetratricopeptide (TPR) repeat protein
VQLQLDDGRAGGRWQFALLGAALVISVLLIYYPVNGYPFLYWMDDNGYVYENSHVLGPLDWTEIKWEFTHSFVLNYDPLTFLGHSINVRLFQLHAGRHHDVNVLLHAINALLLFWLLKRSTGFSGRSFMVAALFAVHPINVENVAWISELKTLLSTLFFFAALIAYGWYAERPKLWRMLAVSFLFGLGLLAKPQVITLPFVLLLWDYWPLRRMFAEGERGASQGVISKEVFEARSFVSLVVEKWPLFLIAAFDAVLTVHYGAHKTIERYTFSIRLGAAIRSYAIYISQAFWPANLAFNYPHPGYGLRWIEVWASLALLLAITALVIACKQQRWLLVGWFWFVGTMLPMINLIQIDTPAMADRYAYVCFVGLFLMACWQVATFAEQRHLPRPELPAVSVALLLVLSIATRKQLGYWRDPVTLCRRSLQVTALPNPGTEWFLGKYLLQHGNADEGLVYLSRSLAEKPREAADIEYVAEVEHQRGDMKQAIFYYQAALAVSNDVTMNAQIYANMGHAYSVLGNWDKAAACFRETQRIRQALPKTRQK